MATVALAACGSGADGPSSAPNSARAGATTSRVDAAFAPTDPAQRGRFDVASWETTIEGHQTSDGRPAPLPLHVWFPTDGEPGVPSTDGPFPLIVYSHGATSAADSSSFLTEHLASHGFVVAAAQHPVRSLAERGDAFAERPREVHAVVDLLLARSSASGDRFEGTIDPERLGVAGHSFGGLTTIALLGETGNRFDAGLAMAPGIRPGDPAGVADAIRTIEVPVMMMMGQADVLARYEHLSAAYATIPTTTTRYALVLPTAGHQSFNDACLVADLCPPGTLDQQQGHELVASYATAFFQVHLAHQTAFASLLQPHDDIADGESRLVAGDLEG